MADRAAGARTRTRAANRVGRPARLNRDDILSAAERLADSGGAASVTMRRVAAQLGVSTMALYRHVADKDALLLAVLDRQLGARRAPRLPRDPRGRVLRLFRWLYDGVDERPWAVQLLALGDVPVPAMQARAEQIVDCFTELGLTRRDAVHAYQACWRYTVGSLLLRHAGEHPDVQAEPPGGRRDFDYGASLSALVDGLVGRT